MYKIFQIIFFFLIYILFFIHTNVLFSNSQYLPKGFKTLPKEVQKILLNKEESIHSFKANIIQYLTIGQTRELRKGYYVATSKGFFKADFYQPKESILYNGKDIYWKIHPNPFTWIIQNKQKNKNNSNLPQNPIAKKNQQKKYWLNDKYSIQYKKKSWWQFWKNEKKQVKFLIKNKVNKENIKITICMKEKQICKREMFDTYNRKIMQESFSKPIRISLLSKTNKMKKIYFYRRIKVIIYHYTTKLRIINDTFYRNPVFNEIVPSKVFYKPQGPFRIFKPKN